MKIRHAEYNDCKFFYECRNDKESRNNARETAFIPYYVHEVWFNKSVHSSPNVFYVGEINERPVGTVRFTCAELTEVAIHMHPSERGKGFGTMLLRKSIDDFLINNIAMQDLFATIRPENKASIRIFQKMGFIPNGELDPKDNGFDVYLLGGENE